MAVPSTREPQLAPPASGDEEVTAYLREAARDRRRTMRHAAMVLAAGAVASGAMVTRMSDIGHATGFGALAVSLLFGALALVIEGR